MTSGPTDLSFLDERATHVVEPATIISPIYQEIPEHCFLTPRSIVDMVLAIWPSGPDLDPFWDPAQLMPCRFKVDARMGRDAYAEDLHCLVPEQDPARPVTVWIHAHETAGVAKKLAQTHDASASCSILALLPLEAGGMIWGRWIWPYASCVLALGRQQLMAGRDIPYPLGHKRAGEIRHRAGSLVSMPGEFALVYFGPQVDRVNAVGRKFGCMRLSAS